jgi:hypothetical protein
MTIATVHGIRSDGSDNVDLLAYSLGLLGHRTKNVDYPRVGLLGARSRKRQYRNAQVLLDNTSDGDDLIVHSYGGLVVLRAMELGRKYRVVFMFNPAMNKDFTFPYFGMKEMYVIYHPDDKAIKWGSWLRFNHDFGEMGRIGYKGPEDPRIINVKAKGTQREKLNHSNFALPKNRIHWVDYIDGVLAKI